MVVINEIWEIVGIITDLFPVFVVLSLIGLFMILLARMIGGGALASKFNLGKRLVIAFPIMLLMFLAITPTNAAPNAVALALDQNVVFGGSVVTLKCTGLTAAQEYTISATGNTASFNNVTFTAASATEYVPVTVPDETDLAFTYQIGASTAGQDDGADATYFVGLTDPAGFLPTDMFMNLVVPLILIGIIVGIAIAIVGTGSKSRGRRG